MEQFGALNINLILLTLGGLVLGLGLMSGILKEKLLLTNPIIAMLVGVLFGPDVLNWLNLNEWGSPEGILKEAARIAIAIQVMGVALRLPPRYLFNHPRPMSIQLGLVMPLMWLVSSGLTAWILGLSVWNALLVGAIITPTDPVVSTSIVTGRLAKEYLPHRIRNLISAESGINDGLAYPFVLLPILFLTRSPQEAFWHWLIDALIIEVGLAIMLGALMGYVAGRLLHWAEDRETIDRQSFLAYTVALALFVLGSTEILGSDSILAVFVAGIAFDNTTNASERAQEEKVQEAVDCFFTIYIFVLFGSALPWQGWVDLGWSGIMLAIAILVLRRLPAMLTLRPLYGKRWHLSDIAFIGWFGPVGVAAVFYAMLAEIETGLGEIWTISSLMITVSIVCYGITSVPLTRLYGRSN